MKLGRYIIGTFASIIKQNPKGSAEPRNSGLPRSHRLLSPVNTNNEGPDTAIDSKRYSESADRQLALAGGNSF